MSKKTTHTIQNKGGILTSIKSETTTTTVEVYKPEQGWFDATFIELLILIDESPRTVQQMIKHSPELRLKTHNQINAVLKMLKEREMVVSNRVNNKHTTWRRTHSFSKHAGGFY